MGKKPSKKGQGRNSTKYPKRFDTLADAVQGIPPSLVEKRKKDGVCARCNWKGHDATTCHREAVKISTKKMKKLEKEEEPSKTSKPSSSKQSSDAHPKVAVTRQGLAYTRWTPMKK